MAADKNALQTFMFASEEHLAPNSRRKSAQVR